MTEFFLDAESQQVIRDSFAANRPMIMRHTNMVDASQHQKFVDCLLTPITMNAADYLLLECNQINAVALRALENSVESGHSANTAVIRGMAHEIKNPLGGLRGAAQLLDRQLPGRSELKDYTNIIIQETDRLCNLVDAISSPQVPPQLRSINIHEVLEHVRKLALAEVPESFTVDRDYDPSLPAVLGDREQLIQAILNITRNAIEATDENGVLRFRSRVAQEVTIDGGRHTSAARIDIEDNGPGIPIELQEHLFFPMISGKFDRNGLGLSFVHQIIKRHGGQVNCKSESGRTCFSILLKFADGS